MPHRWTPHAGRRGLVLVLGLLLFGGCVPDGLTDYDFKQHQPPAAQPEDTVHVLVGEREATGLRIALYIHRGPHTGYNRVRVRLTAGASGAVIDAAGVQLRPHYTLGPRSLSVPVEQPVSDRAQEEGFFEGAVMLLPPEPGAGRFALEIAFERTSGQTGAVTFPLEVEESRWMQRIETPGGRLFAAWVYPARPVVGDNVLEVALYREAGDGYAPVTDAAMDCYPYMDMGGGDGHSTPYEAPVHTGAGRYRGRVNFIMAGGWDLALYVRRPAAPPDTVRFDGFRVY